MAENDYDWYLQNETKSLSNTGDIPTEYQKSFNKDIFYKHRVTESFPFWHITNNIKNTCPKIMQPETLYEVASTLQNRLESTDISKLNYEVTSRFFMEIEQYFWDYPPFFLEHRIANRNEITDEIFATLKRFQDKTRAYLKKSIKENELKDMRIQNQSKA